MFEQFQFCEADNYNIYWCADSAASFYKKVIFYRI
jgi:hypothetical protein